MLYYVIATIINYILICVFATTGWLDCGVTMSYVKQHPIQMLIVSIIFAWWGKGLSKFFFGD